MQFELTLLERVTVSPFNAAFILAQAIRLFSFPVFLLLFGILLLGIVQVYRMKTNFPRKLIWYSLAASAYPMGISLMGGLFVDSGYIVIIYMLYAVVLRYVGVLIYLLVREKGWRMLIALMGVFCRILSRAPYSGQ